MLAALVAAVGILSRRSEGCGFGGGRFFEGSGLKKSLTCSLAFPTTRRHRASMICFSTAISAFDFDSYEHVKSKFDGDYFLRIFSYPDKC